MENEFLIELQAKLDEAKSKNNLNGSNGDIAKLQGQLDKLKLQAIIDDATISELVKQLEEILNQKITISNINVDGNGAIKAAQNTGEKIGDALNKGVEASTKKIENSQNQVKDTFNGLKDKIINSIKEINKQGFDESKIESYNDLFNKLKSEYKDFGQVKITNEVFKNVDKDLKFDGLEKFKVNIEHVNGDLKETRSFILELSNDKGQLIFNGTINGAESVVQHLDKAQNAINQTGDAINELKAKNLADKIDLGDYNKKFETLQSSYRKLGLTSDEIESKTNDVAVALDKIKEKNLDTLVQDEKEFADALKKSQNEAAILKTNLDSIYNPKRQAKLTNDIRDWLSKNTKASTDAKMSIEAYYNELSGGRVSVARLEEISQGLKDIDSMQRKLGNLGKSVIDQIREGFGEFTQWFSISSGIMLAASKTREAITEFKNLDDILTEISKTSDLTVNQLAKLGSESFRTASKYGKTASDYLTGVQDMSQSGFYGEQGTAMAEQSLLAQAAGDMSAEIANKYVLATNAAYKFDGAAEKINAVLDGQNSISNRNSVALEDMAMAMSEAGTVASSYRVSIEDLSAMIGTIESVTKSGGSEVGNSLKSILINLQNVTSDKIVETLNAANASMTEFVNGSKQLRDPISILRDLAKTFNQLDEADPLRAEILTNIGGKHQATKLAALLQNMQMFDKMLVDYSEGSGSAMEEAQKSATNLSGSINTLTNSWNEFVNFFITADGLKDGVNFLNELVQGATNLVDVLNNINTINGNINGMFGTLGAASGLLMNKKGIGECTIFQW